MNAKQQSLNIENCNSELHFISALQTYTVPQVHGGADLKITITRHFLTQMLNLFFCMPLGDGVESMTLLLSSSYASLTMEVRLHLVHVTAENRVRIK